MHEFGLPGWPSSEIFPYLTSESLSLVDSDGLRLKFVGEIKKFINNVFYSTTSSSTNYNFRNSVRLISNIDLFPLSISVLWLIVTYLMIMNTTPSQHFLSLTFRIQKTCPISRVHFIMPSPQLIFAVGIQQIIRAVAATLDDTTVFQH